MGSFVPVIKHTRGANSDAGTARVCGGPGGSLLNSKSELTDISCRVEMGAKRCHDIRYSIFREFDMTSDAPELDIHALALPADLSETLPVYAYIVLANRMN